MLMVSAVRFLGCTGILFGSEFLPGGLTVEWALPSLLYGQSSSVGDSPAMAKYQYGNFNGQPESNLMLNFKLELEASG